jgi:hypothetical protein
MSSTFELVLGSGYGDRRCSFHPVRFGKTWALCLEFDRPGALEPMGPATNTLVLVLDIGCEIRAEPRRSQDDLPGFSELVRAYYPLSSGQWRLLRLHPAVRITLVGAGSYDAVLDRSTDRNGLMRLAEGLAEGP